MLSRRNDSERNRFRAPYIFASRTGSSDGRRNHENQTPGSQDLYFDSGGNPVAEEGREDLNSHVRSSHGEDRDRVPPESAFVTGNFGFIDPYETPVRRASDDEEEVMYSIPMPEMSAEPPFEDEHNDPINVNPRHASALPAQTNGIISPSNATFLKPSQIHPNMLQRDDDVAQLQLLAGTLAADWKGQDFMAPALARRIRDFQFAQDRRRRRYGDERPFGILGLYDHLASIRVDVEWAEDAAWRRANGEPYLSWTDFEDSKKKGSNRPFFTYFLLAACTVILIASIALNNWKVEQLDVNPMIGPSAQTLIRMGAKDSYLIVHEDEAWRLVSSIGLHAGLVHYFINMLALYFVGSAIETSHGFIAAMVLFVIPAIGGTILSAIFLPEYITVGASGGIFGLIGACLGDILMNWKLLFSSFVTENAKKHRHAFVVVCLVMDIALNSIIGLTPYVDNFTHLGGMIIGLLCGISTMERLSPDFFGVEQSCWSKTKQYTIRFFGLIVSVISIVVATIILMKGDGETNPCPSCTWLSCVPFPPWKGSTWWYCDDCGRVTAQIIYKPSLHLELKCPDATSIAIDLDPDLNLDRKALEKHLPEYCRDFCPKTTEARRYRDL